MKCVFAFVFLFALAVSSFIGANGAGECPKSTPDMEAMKLIPCAEAAQDETASVSSSCCAQVKKLGQNPKCLCAVMLSNTAKSSGVKPEVAITIPKRCNLADRPIGYKCGAVSSFIGANGAGECPKSTPDVEALKLTSCVDAAQDANATVSSTCCTQVKRVGQNPKCLCAVMLLTLLRVLG
ncbi:OLC1v1026655C1 [Oldenlandia corymbosa var. corymbosa]|uniref:OLC1v1026655C1 n=1 Tax=Oldenlandia corymbosa var. corymbosa TaxID=529605 RepID=A0AAV1C9T2_OLDCO|nr:OLC1v1026655C1 [Oldenlandia corymbosa var. corymbosa]